MVTRATREPTQHARAPPQLVGVSRPIHPRTIGPGTEFSRRPPRQRETTIDISRGSAISDPLIRYRMEPDSPEDNVGPTQMRIRRETVEMDVGMTILGAPV